MEALGYATYNRFNSPDAYYFKGSTIDDIIIASKEFQEVGSKLWKDAENPANLTGDNAKAYAKALEVSIGILAGNISDPTNGCTYFDRYNPKVDSHQGMINRGTIVFELRIGQHNFYKLR